MADPYQIGGAIYSALANNADLITELGGTAIYDSLAPITTDLPYVIFQWQGGGDTNFYASRSLNEVWTVKAVAATLAKAKSVAKEVDEALHDQTLSPTGWTNFWTRREQEVSLTETDDSGALIYHRGGQYRIRVEET